MAIRRTGTLLALGALALGAAVFLVTHSSQREGVINVSVPRLSADAAAGRTTFNSICAACHGQDGSGSDAGPPLIHKIYEPGHHGDHTFRLAVKTGVRAHHWSFGNMPPIADVSTRQVEHIISFVREVQRHNGIN
ncbi:MAG: cytochrome c [Pseudomonadota bacterium]